jgi:hypothetical protein
MKKREVEMMNEALRFKNNSTMTNPSQNTTPVEDKSPLEEEIENWKPIPNSVHEVSSHGNIRHIKLKKNRKFYPHPDGYWFVSFRVSGKQKTFTVHRLVAIAFVPNPHGYETVNHEDLNKQNNHFKNLTWCTHLENMKHASKNKRWYNSPSEEGKRRIIARHIKTIYAYNLVDKSVLKFSSFKECANHFGVSKGSVSSSIFHNSNFKKTYRLYKEESWNQFKQANNQ